ncbi:MAG: PHP domain-containing protein [Gemmatimonadota bacterium]|nr:PHP domain-containing protein [Gemmatimonadota bacterium]
MRVDFHTHTSRSADALTSPRALVARAAAAGLDRIAVTDHGRIDGALAAADVDPDRVIVGEEVHCREGVHLIGLYVSAHVPHDLSVRDAAGRIRDQGGVVYAPHPFAYPWDPARKADLVLGVAELVEVFNARAFFPPWNRQAAAAAAARGLPAAASSDAHFPWEIGRAWTELPPFAGAAELRAVVAQARPVPRVLTTPVVHGLSLGLELLRTLGR